MDCQIGLCCNCNGIVNYHNRIYWNTCHKEGKKEEEKTAIMDHTYGVAVLALDEAADFFGGMVYKQTTYDSEQKLK